MDEKKFSSEERLPNHFDQNKADIIDTISTSIDHACDDDPIRDNEVGFPKATIIRLMKENLPKDVHLRKSVKDGMNSFLYNILKDVCNELAKYPYTTIEYEMFKGATFLYRNIKTIDSERKSLLSRLDTIQHDIELMKTDINSRMKSVEND